MILQQLAEYAVIRVAEDMKIISSEDMKSKALSLEKKGFEFEMALKKNKPAIISEVKKASPSKGVISHEFDYISISQEYERAGADCISVLTEPKWFMGSDYYFTQIRKNVSIPMLRKDFTVDEYQIYQARVMGADAVLLICALLDTQTISRYIKICDTLGISALVETHDEFEIESAVNSGARIIGVNNRNLKDFSVDIDNSGKLRKNVPENVIFVAESGISSPEDALNVFRQGADALLIGEALMKSNDKADFIRQIRNGASHD